MNLFSSPPKKGGRVKGLTPLKSKQGHAAFDDEVRDDISYSIRDDSNRPKLVSKTTTFDSIAKDPDFRTTRVTVTVLGIMGGIKCETNGKTAKQINHGNGRVLGDVPVIAVVTGFNQITPNQVSATHIPSMPLSGRNSTQESSRKHNLAAIWETDSDSLSEQQTQSTVSFKRRVKVMHIDTHLDVQDNRCMYTAEKLTLVISLMRGAEMITLGTCLVHFTGTESKQIQISLPVKVTKEAVHKAVSLIKGTKMKKKLQKSDRRKVVKPVSFKGDPSRAYSLDEDASLSILLSSLYETNFTEDDMVSVSDLEVDSKLASRSSEDSEESNEFVAIDASTRHILNLPNIGAPYSLSLIGSSIMNEEDSTFQRNEFKSMKPQTPNTPQSMSSFSFSSASFEMPRYYTDKCSV